MLTLLILVDISVLRSFPMHTSAYHTKAYYNQMIYTTNSISLLLVIWDIQKRCFLFYCKYLIQEHVLYAYPSIKTNMLTMNLKFV